MINNEIGEIRIKKPKKDLLLLVWQITKVVIVSILAVLFVRYYIAEPFFVKGASMELTFVDGDYLLINEIGYRLNSPKRGDIVVFRYPLDQSQFFIKRIIGLPGETVEVSDNTVKIISSSNTEWEVLKEDYLDKTQKTFGNVMVKLKDNQYFVMGDNRLHSSDSRQWGVLDKKFIDGKVTMRLWPLNTIKLVHKVEY